MDHTLVVLLLKEVAAHRDRLFSLTWASGNMSTRTLNSFNYGSIW